MENCFKRSNRYRFRSTQIEFFDFLRGTISNYFTLLIVIEFGKNVWSNEIVSHPSRVFINSIDRRNLRSVCCKHTDRVTSLFMGFYRGGNSIDLSPSMEEKSRLVASRYLSRNKSFSLYKYIYIYHYHGDTRFHFPNRHDARCTRCK